MRLHDFVQILANAFRMSQERVDDVVPARSRWRVPTKYLVIIVVGLALALTLLVVWFMKHPNVAAAPADPTTVQRELGLRALPKGFSPVDATVSPDRTTLSLLLVNAAGMQLAISAFAGRTQSTIAADPGPRCTKIWIHTSAQRFPLVSCSSDAFGTGSLVGSTEFYAAGRQYTLMETAAASVFDANILRSLIVQMHGQASPAKAATLAAGGSTEQQASILQAFGLQGLPEHMRLIEAQGRAPKAALTHRVLSLAADRTPPNFSMILTQIVGPPGRVREAKAYFAQTQLAAYKACTDTPTMRIDGGYRVEMHVRSCPSGSKQLARSVEYDISGTDRLYTVVGWGNPDSEQQKVYRKVVAGVLRRASTR